MTKNQYQFMIITGKYLPDEDIRCRQTTYYFYRYKGSNLIYFENSNGNWEKREYNENNRCVYYKDSKGYWERRNDNNVIIDSGNYND